MRTNILHLDLADAYDADDPAGFRAAGVNVAALLGGATLTVKVYELPAGETICPYHYEFDEEWLLVLTGAVDLRIPAGVERIGQGELVCFPPGPAGAHRVAAVDGTARVLMFSTSRNPAVAVYPDSQKVGVWPAPDAPSYMARLEDAQRPYYDREA